MNLNPFKSTPWYKKQQNTLVNAAAVLIVLDRALPLILGAVGAVSSAVRSGISSFQARRAPAAETTQGEYRQAA